MSEQKQPYEPVPNFAGGHATWKRERDSLLSVLKEHGIIVEHEVTFPQTLPAEENITGTIDNFSGENHTYNWTIDGHGLQGVSYSFEETIGNIVGALKEKGATVPVPEMEAYRTMETALQALAGQVLNLRADLLVIKAAIIKNSGQEKV